MKIFIAGATGVLGRRMMRQFLSKNHEVIGLARDEKGAQRIEVLGGKAIICNLFKSDLLAESIGQADAIIHAATSIPTKAPSETEDWEMNDRLRYEGTQSLTKAAAKVGAKIYVQQSVVWVARPPDDSFFDENTKIMQPEKLYQSAYSGEQIAFEAGAKLGFNVSVLRGAGFYAADARHTRILAKGLLKRRLPIIGDGNGISANIHVEDAASAFVAATEAGKQGLWHITDDDSITIKEMFSEFAHKLGAPAPWRLPKWLAKLFLGKEIVGFFVRSTRTSNQLFKREFGWSPRFPTLLAGLEEVIQTWQTEGYFSSGGNK